MRLLARHVPVGPGQRLDPVSAAMAEQPLGTPPDLPGPAVLDFLACAAVVHRRAFRQIGGFSWQCPNGVLQRRVDRARRTSIYFRAIDHAAVTRVHDSGPPGEPAAVSASWSGVTGSDPSDESADGRLR
ncbi:hypothetical protein [Micromonospora pisi]|uniref:hypothetical protein n=1 Tax=Micromonospora pisi TaxID=589240 RepID=UPI0011C46D3C|nr:hypothetical protein [Micromonospora pisi]